MRPRPGDAARTVCAVWDLASAWWASSRAVSYRHTAMPRAAPTRRTIRTKSAVRRRSGSAITLDLSYVCACDLPPVIDRNEQIVRPRPPRRPTLAPFGTNCHRERSHLAGGDVALRP